MNETYLEKTPHALKYTPDLQTKTCPKCDSVFVTSKECESCGFQLKLNFIGEPLDRKSFYTMQDKYVRAIKKAFFSSTKKDLRKEYKRAIWHRFDVLLNHFPDPENEHFSFFSIELKDLVEELLIFNMSVDKLKFKCVQSEVPALKKYISEIITEWQANHQKASYPGIWEFFNLHSSNIRMWFVIYSTLIFLAYIGLFMKA